MDILTLIKTVVMFAVIVLTAAAVVILVIKEGKIEVKPNRAVVVNNIWSGVSRELLQGTHLIIPGWEKILKEVTLENEPSNPDIIKVVTADGTELGIDYVIAEQRVVNPVLAVTRINYEKRLEFINVRWRALFQDEISGLKMEDLLFSEAAGKVLSKEKMKEIEDKVNRAYAAIEADAGKNWGIKVEIQLVNLVLPKKLADVAEDSATAGKEGERIKLKAQKAGVDPIWIVAGDILKDIIGTFKGGGK